MIIGLCGAARSGKDAFASYLACECLAYTHTFIQIAGPLKKYLQDLFDWTSDHTDDYLKDVPDPRYPIQCPTCLGTGKVPSNGQTNCPLCGGEGTVGLTPRHAMQQLGGEFAQSTSPNIYAIRAARKAKEAMCAARKEKGGGLALITDCRYLHDIKAIKAVGGVIIEVSRPKDLISTKVLSHASETARLQPEFQALVDIHINNDGTLNELREKAWKTISNLEAKGS